MAKILDVNDVTVKLFGARSKDELLVSLHKVFLPETEGSVCGRTGSPSLKGEPPLNPKPFFTNPEGKQT